jgi:hypothetical protein
MQRLYASALLISTLALTACGSDDDDDAIAEVFTTPAAASSQIRVIHASADAPMVNILANGNVLLMDVDYAQSSGLQQATMLLA